MSQFLGSVGAFLPPPHPWVAPKMPILNRVKLLREFDIISRLKILSFVVIVILKINLQFTLQWRHQNLLTQTSELSFFWCICWPNIFCASLSDWKKCAAFRGHVAMPLQLGFKYPISSWYVWHSSETSYPWSHHCLLN